jgi:uncharacterized RDD family membrane protein YckC
MAEEGAGSSGAPAEAGLPGDYAGFWRRVGAFLVDASLLGIVGQLLGLLLAEEFSRLGNGGRLVGLAVAGAYLVPSYGTAMSGQSLGKRLLGLRVQSIDGGTVGLPRAALRYLVLAIPLLLNGVYFAVATPAWFAWAAGLILVTIVFGGLLGDTYLLLFNRPDRRLLHDLAARTVVLRAPAAGAVEPQPLRRRHAIALLVVPVAVIGAIALAGRLMTSLAPELGALRRVQGAIASMPHVVAAGVNDVTQTSAGRSARILQLTVRLTPWPAAPESTASEYVATARQALPDLDAFGRVTVTLTHGFDIGIASRWQSMTYSHPAKDWPQPSAAAQ